MTPEQIEARIKELEPTTVTPPGSPADSVSAAGRLAAMYEIVGLRKALGKRDTEV